MHQKVFILKTTLLVDCAVCLSWHYSCIVTKQQTETEHEYAYFAHVLNVCVDKRMDMLVDNGIGGVTVYETTDSKRMEVACAW